MQVGARNAGSVRCRHAKSHIASRVTRRVRDLDALRQRHASRRDHFPTPATSPTFHILPPSLLHSILLFLRGIHAAHFQIHTKEG